ncbi:hypothetical protein Fcan01_03053 [Folsomia candida]|uniref:Uncharacterized protein n=1 Tax=Folsomia candida TaxID=158441 RepID=A0A226EWH0_FOLCA|nr:hypothetical protein Fcan01_03053 [Folsomia candida]
MRRGEMREWNSGSRHVCGAEFTLNPCRDHNCALVSLNLGKSAGFIHLQDPWGYKISKCLRSRVKTVFTTKAWKSERVLKTPKNHRENTRVTFCQLLLCLNWNARRELIRLGPRRAKRYAVKWSDKPSDSSSWGHAQSLGSILSPSSLKLEIGQVQNYPNFYSVRVGLS